MHEQCEGQGELHVRATDFEPPYGRYSPLPTELLRPLKVTPEGFLEAAGCLLGSYTLEDRTVFVFEQLTMEVMRGAGLYAFSWPKSTS